MRFFVVLLFCLLAFPLPSFAAPPTCSVVSEGVIVYNKDHKVMQYCDGVNWIGMSGSAAQSIDTLGELECDTGEIAKYDGTAWTCSEDTGGLAALQGTNDPGPCTLAKDGLIKYNASGSPKWHYCDGGTTSWLPFRLPQCQNDDAGECTLAALRLSNDAQLKPSSIRCGDNILGVTGTYGSGSSNAFTFTNATNVALSTLTTASAITVSGILSGCPGEVIVTGTGNPQISVAGGAWGTTGTISNGQTLAVRLTSNASPATANTAEISIGATNSLWSVTTLAADTTPAAFDFTPNVTNAPISTLTAASAVTITGVNAATPVTVSGVGAQISINGGAWGTTGTILNGQTLAVRLTSSASYSTAMTATVDVGGVTDIWSVTTLPADTTPNAFDFTPNVTGAALSTLTTASNITIAGINASTPVSVTGAGAEISINGGAWGTSGNITAGQTLGLRLTSSATPATAITATVTVGGVTDTWSVTTLAADTTPTAFDFTPNVTGANPSTLTAAANTVTIAGINTAAPVTISGAGAEFSIAGGAWGTTGNITNGQTLNVRLTSSAAFSTAITATVNVGGVTDTWSVTTRAANTCIAASKTWLTNCTATVTAAAHGANGTGTITNPGVCGTGWYGSGTFGCSDGTFSYSSGTCTQQAACDTTPTAFDFTPNVTGANPSTLTTAANTVTIAGINTSTPVSVSGVGAQISINGGAWVTSGNITNGQTLRVRLTSSATHTAVITATVDVGGVTDAWSVTTRAIIGCSTQTINWAPGCSVASGAMTHTQAKTVTNAAGGYTGIRNLTCTDGAISQSGGSCASIGTTCEPGENPGCGPSGDYQIGSSGGMSSGQCLNYCGSLGAGYCVYHSDSGDCRAYQSSDSESSCSSGYMKAYCN